MRPFDPRMILVPLLAAICLLAPAPVLAGRAEALAREGVQAYERQDYEAAVKAFRRAAELKPEARDYHFNLGTALAREEKLDEAEAAFRKALESGGAEGFETDMAYNLAYALARGAAGGEEQADPKAMLKKLREAVDGFRQAVIADPKDYDAKYNLETSRLMLHQLEQQMQQQLGDGEKKDQQDDKGKEKNQDQSGDGQGGDQGQDGEKSEDQESQDENGDQENKDGDSGGEQGDEEKKDQQTQQKGLEDQSAPQPAPGEEQGKDGQQPEQSKQEKGMDQQQRQPNNPDPIQQGEGQKGEPSEAQLTSEQLDALRVLNSLADQKPEQFKRLFQFKGQRQKRERDW